MPKHPIDRPAFIVRPAEPRDVEAVVRLIRALAGFEKLTHLLQVTPESLSPHLFGARPVAEALVAESDARVVAFALFFTNFSTFLARPGLYLEDLFVEPGQRGRGIGKALLEQLARLALARGCGRFEWSVLDWNVDAIRFYERMGATVMAQWRICRVGGAALASFGAPAGAGREAGPGPGAGGGGPVDAEAGADVGAGAGADGSADGGAGGDGGD